MLVRIRQSLLQRLFHLLYHQLAWTYDAISAVVSLGSWQEWGAAALPFLPGPRVLELGHGPGHLLVRLSSGHWRPVGLDLSPQMNRLARQRLRRLASPVPLILGRAQTLPFQSASFDGLVATFPTPYILSEQTMREARRVLRPDGRLVIVPEAEIVQRGLLARVVRWLNSVSGQGSSFGNDGPAEEPIWSGALRAQGFRVSIHHVTLSSSVVLVVVADRAATALRP